MGKKILILGTGAQGSTVAMRMDEEPNVEKIICADYNLATAEEAAKPLKKAEGIRVDASDKDSIVKAAEGVDLVVNALPLELYAHVLDATLEAGTNYQDFATTVTLAEVWEENFRMMYEDYGPKFAAIDRTAVFATGSAPGLICVASRRAVRELDSCETIINMVYEGVESKRFIPFWWSPQTAVYDMGEEGYACENGKIIRTPAFGMQIVRDFDYTGLGPMVMGEHEHDEPLLYCFNKDTHFKGLKNAYFKYGGAGYEWARSLRSSGFLSYDAIDVNGVDVVPIEFVKSIVPPAPKYKEEIQEIIHEGLVTDSGCMCIEAYGIKDGKKTLVELHVMAPGLVDSFRKSGLTAEMYITGQGGAMFTKMFVNDKFDQRGAISSDMLTDEQVDYYFAEAAKLDITLDIRIKDWEE